MPVSSDWYAIQRPSGDSRPSRCQADLVQEALGPEHRAELRMQHLERHPPVVPKVAGQIDRGHAAAPELALETVIVGYGPLEPVLHVVGHGRELYY